MSDNDELENSQPSEAEEGSKDATPATDSAESSELKDSKVSGMRWYILHAYSNCEDKVTRTLLDLVAHSELQDKFGEIIVPAEEVVEMHRGKKRKVRRKNFPGYVLVQMVLDEDTWYLVRKAPNVLGFLGGTAGKPVPISDAEADTILLRASAAASLDSSALRPKIVFDNGEVVRIIDGPFVDFDGVVEHVNYEKSRLSVSVVVFSRATPVELEFSEVEKI
jgi:transcription termination/antitermination protein NusG